ncbi:hypothetical protein DIPPA_01943 [Diplonema papillatum]|nr:hypothetical protein DIPPA_01943 [Diplonema papillatum]
MWDEISPATNKLFRNGSLYGAVCAALRDQGPQGPKGAWSEKIVKKWIKWICTLAACTATDKPSRTALWRGLGGGGLPGDVVDMHATLKEGDLLAWPAPSSASFNYETSREYVFGTAVNSTGSPSQEKPGTIMFNIKSALGLPLQAISQYPTEEELLLSPLTVFTVRGVARDAANRFGKGLSVEMACQGPMGGAASECAWLRSFYDRVRADAKRGSAVIGQRVQSLHLEPKPFDGNDSLVATIKTQLESQRSKTSDLRSQLEDEMRELRKESAGNAKWKRMYELEKAGRDELGAKLAEEARGAAAARLQADQALREANARLQAAKAEVEKLRADVKSERLQASAQLDEARRKLDVEKTCLSGREAELTAKLSAMESENAKHARDARTQQEEAQLWKKRHDEAIHQAAESARGLEAKLSDKLAAVSSELRELKLDFAEVRSQKEQLTTEATRWQTQAEAREAETERTRERMAADREKQREELAAQLGKAAALERELEASRAQTNLDASEAARARQDREREQHAAAELKRKLDDAKRNHASETEALADRLKDEESQRRRTTQELARAKEAASSARNDAQDYRRRLEACQAELQRARELGRGDASELESKLQAAKEESAAARSTLQRDLALSKTAAAQAAARANALELECDRKVRLAQEEANLTAARLQEVLNSKIRALADAQGELRREHDSRISAAAAAEADRAQAQADARKQDALLADLTQHNKTLQAAVRAAELEAADAQKSAARLAAKAQEAEAAEAHAKTALQAVAGGSKGLLEQIEDKEREVALLRSEHRAYIEKLNEQMRVLRAEVQCEQLRVEDQKDTVVKCRREIARLHDLLSLAKRETDDAKFEAGASRSPVDWAGSSMTFVGSPTHRRVLSSPLTPSPRVESSSSYAAHSLAASDIPSPGLQRLETTIRRFRMEVDSVKHSLPSSPLRPSGSSLGRAS